MNLNTPTLSLNPPSSLLQSDSNLSVQNLSTIYKAPSPPSPHLFPSSTCSHVTTESHPIISSPVPTYPNNVTTPTVQASIKDYTSKAKKIQVMDITKVDQDTASVTLFNHQDNVNDTINYLTTMPSSPTINNITSAIATPTSPTKECVTAVHDSGASALYIREEDEDCVTNVVPHIGPLVTLPNAEKVQSSKKSLLPLSPHLSIQGQTGHILPELKSSTLISTGQLCDDGCDVVYRENTVHVLKNKIAMDNFLSSQKSILTGQQNRVNNL